MVYFNQGRGPGMQAKIESDEAQIWWGHENLRILDPVGKIASASTDDVSSPTTLLRAGLVMAKNASDVWVPYDADAGDVTGVARGVLAHAQSMLNPTSGSAENKVAQIIVGGLVKSGQCKNLDAAARRSLESQGVLFDTGFALPSGAAANPAGPSYRGVIRKSANYSVLSSDNGSLLVATAAVNFTLPTSDAGLVFEFLQTADANMTIIGGTNIVVDGSAAASQIAFSTASHKIGSRIRVECIYTAANTKRWIVSNLGGTTMTIA